MVRFMGPTRGPPGSFRPQVGPMLAHEPCYQGKKAWTPTLRLRYFARSYDKTLSAIPRQSLGYTTYTTHVLYSLQYFPKNEKETDNLFNPIDEYAQRIFVSLSHRSCTCRNVNFLVSTCAERDQRDNNGANYITDISLRRYWAKMIHPAVSSILLIYLMRQKLLIQIISACDVRDVLL